MDGRPVGRVFVDGGAVLNVMPVLTLKKLGKTTSDLISTNMQMTSFTSGISKAIGVLMIDVTVGSKTSPTAFFVIDAKPSYSTLLGRDWIHANSCVPSTLHQLLMFWNEGEVEIV